MKTILLIAGIDERYYYDAFLKASKQRSLKVCVFDPDRIPLQATLNATMDQHGCISGFVDTLNLNDDSDVLVRLSLSDIDAAWYVRENTPPEHEDQSMEARFARNESRKAIVSLISILDCTWINHPDTIETITSNKLYQQKIAGSCGLTVPYTIMSNDPSSIHAAATQQGELLIKSIGYITLNKVKACGLYSERFSSTELLASGAAIAACPVYAQHYVEKLYEYRVMVIGDRVLACRIDSQASEQTKTDWRHYDFENVEHVRAELPAIIQGKLLHFMRKIGLRYGALDLIE